MLDRRSLLAGSASLIACTTVGSRPASAVTVLGLIAEFAVAVAATVSADLFKDWRVKHDEKAQTLVRQTNNDLFKYRSFVAYNESPVYRSQTNVFYAATLERPDVNLLVPLYRRPRSYLVEERFNRFGYEVDFDDYSNCPCSTERTVQMRGDGYPAQYLGAIDGPCTVGLSRACQYLSLAGYDKSEIHEWLMPDNLVSGGSGYFERSYGPPIKYQTRGGAVTMKYDNTKVETYGGAGTVSIVAERDNGSVLKKSFDIKYVNA